MRITAGIHRSRTIHTPKNKNIRPTSDKVRGAIFNALQARMQIQGANTADIFCGTGTLGLEALSRGAHHCTFFDKDRGSMDLTKSNVQSLGEEGKSTFVLCDATNLKEKDENVRAFDLVFLDPPYHKDLIAPVLLKLIECAWLAPEAMIILESEKSAQIDAPTGFDRVNEKIYGDTMVTLLKTPE